MDRSLRPGARWIEDYSDPDSNVSRFGSAIAGGGSLDAFVAGMLLFGATGHSTTESMQKKRFDPLGMQGPGDRLLDSTTERARACLTGR